MMLTLKFLSRPGLTSAAVVMGLGLAAMPAVAGAPPALRALSGAEQQTTYRSAFPSPLVVWVTDGTTGRSAAGVRVRFTAASCLGLSAETAVTDQRGLAMVTATGLKPCRGSVSASVEGNDKETVSFDGLVVNKAVLIVLPADTASTPGAVPSITDYYITGFVNGENEDSAHISGAPVLTTTATAGSTYGNYAIKGGVGTLTADNYTFEPGFGTLAITVDPNSRRARDHQEQGLTVPAAKPDTATVQPALDEQMTSMPADFVGSERKDAGVPVRRAIHASVATATPTLHSTIAPAAMPGFVSSNVKETAAPVRAALLHAQAADSKLAKPAHPAIVAVDMPGFETGAAKESSGEVRAAIGEEPPVLAPAAHATAATPIRKALNPPGTN